jgi:arginine repressor
MERNKPTSEPPQDRRRSLRGIAPREAPILEWRAYAMSKSAAAGQRAERRGFVLRLLQMPIDWAPTRMLMEQVEAYFGLSPGITVIENDLRSLGAVRVPLKPGSQKTRWQLLEGHTPDSLMLELHDRFAVDVLRVLRHESTVVVDTSRGVTQAVHELLKLASADRLLPGYLYALHDGEDTVVVVCASSGSAIEWVDRLNRVLHAARPKKAFG